MNLICSWFIANSFIKESLKERIYITPLKLNCLVYLLYSDYLFNTGEKLFNEPFVKTNKGPVLPNIEFKFGSFKNNVITEYAKNSVGKIIITNGTFFEERLFYIWNSYKNMSDMEILAFINNTGSMLKKQNDEILKDTEILDDEINRNEKILEKAKYNRKKILSH